MERAVDAMTYPITFSVDYPDRPLDRLSTAFRVFAAIPILIVLGTVSGATWRSASEGRSTVAGTDGSLVLVAAGGGLLFIAPLLMIVVRQKYP
ncbi:MAG: hypothetical protein H0V00_00525, partial [Chloroflexia bacterium]|nr:hypothetical protein [Chloroflexia bacterium]